MFSQRTPRTRSFILLVFALLLSMAQGIPAAHAVPGTTGSVEFIDNYPAAEVNNGTGMITSTGAVTTSGTNDFTHEMWIKPDSVDTFNESVLFTTATSRFTINSLTTGDCNSLTLMIMGGKVGYTFGHWKSNTAAALSGELSGGIYRSTTVLSAAWHHIALTQTSNVIKLWIDGVEAASSGNIPSTSDCKNYWANYLTTPISLSDTGLYFGQWFVGRISNYRYTLNSARYTSAFTPPSEALTSSNANEWLVPFNYTTSGTYELIRNGVTTTPFTVQAQPSDPTGNSRIVDNSVISREFNPFNKLTPTFTWANVTKNVGDSSFTLTAPTPSTPGTFTYSSATTSVISLSGTTATVGNAGTSVITASFTPTNTVDYNSTTTTMTITVVGSGQTITFGALADKIMSDSSPTLSATSSSGLTVAFSSATTGVCTVSGTTVTLVAPGTCTINANQAGNGTYAAASQVQRSFVIAYLTQSISFDALTGATLGVSSAPLIRGSSSSGLGVIYSSVTPGVCSVSGTTISLLNPGTCTISASQSGNGTYSAATSVSQSFSITAKPDDGQKELMAILTLLPELASISKNIGDLAVNSMTKCVKGKLVKKVKKGAKCPKTYRKVIGS